ncbi:hypothetical protein KY290_021273 [Solanum tuberosum]|uniref:Uncharacterized protein n=1 Tax=Solanum tuberosum TaxID=4113 RepID=A0ABQ7V456_SOLTU|nr:hypothetical protein KY289_022400 [Solanum tuberosum]KAH0693096.1 hypothetical protein KY285_020193 [Solanum tuberosum]KAH0757780.1 hypothetical protein KY290_021273 [Solanum tuberosum]
MDSGDGSSIPRMRTRQQFLKYCVEFIEKRNKSTQNANTSTQSSTVSCGRKTVKLEEKNTCFGGVEKPKMGKMKVESSKRKFSPGTCESVTKRPFIQEIYDDDDDDDDVVIIATDSSDSESSSNVGLRAVKDVISSSSSKRGAH